MSCNSKEVKLETHKKETEESLETYEEELVLVTEEDLNEVQDWEETMSELKSPALEAAEMEEYLTDIKNRFPCPECPKKFAKRSDLNTHQLSHSNQRSFKCPRKDCNSAFNVLSRLTRHLRKVHQAFPSEIDPILKASKIERLKKASSDSCPTVDVTPVQCDICFRDYSCVKYLKEHRILQHYSDDAPFACAQAGCNKKFTDWSLLEKHQRAHEGIFDYKCQYCGRGYVQRKVLNQHLKKSHQISQEKIDAMQRTDSFCKDCNVKYKTPRQFSEHIALEHGNGEKLFVCDKCAKVFLSRVKLISHLKYHQDEKKKSCSRCPSSFTEERGLKTHLRRVHKLTEGEIFEAFLKR